MQKTLIVLKPDAVARGITGELLTRFERAGLKIVGLKMVAPDESHYHHHYENIGQLISRRGEEVYRRNADFMMMGPVIAAVLEGVEAVATVRKMVGETEPHAAAPGTIRGDYAHMTIKHANQKGGGLANLIHASADEAEAEAEIMHWFKAEELLDYKTAHQDLTQ
ncbi:MAG TPA: nucleoside-diphosphate kinase [Candidatus Saccharimonadales bacterium]|nr:nucleoside-diphosphate kinase [Candidatus Saccharimonadales bacterium]